MKLLIMNCGSSSLSFKIFEQEADQKTALVLQGKAHRVGVTGTEESFIEFIQDGKRDVIHGQINNHAEAAQKILFALKQRNFNLNGVGHRIVHGGVYFQKTVVLDEKNLPNFLETLPLAPIHNPNAYQVIQECMQAYPSLPQFVTFDTNFHSQIPDVAAHELLPDAFVKKHNIRHYGFHGISYSYVLNHIRQEKKLDIDNLKIIACHLGTGGSSITAIQNGVSIDTSMGYTPLQGLVMSTRCGDLDPFLPLYLMQVYHYQAGELNQAFNKKSGLLGLSGFSSDVRDILKKEAGEHDVAAAQAVAVLVHRLKKYIGAYAAILGGLDLLIFTDDIGIQNPVIRQRVCSQMDWLGIQLDEQKNDAAPLDALSEIQAEESRVRIMILPTDEESIIAHDGFSLLQERGHAAI